MLKETVTYTDYNGIERTEDYYFNLTKAEVTEMEVAHNGGFSEYCRKIIDAKEISQLVKIFKELMLKAYGEKSGDGRYFLKLDENGNPLANKFAQTEAFSILFMKYSLDADAAAKFINGIFPSK